VFGECQIVINGLAVEREVENARTEVLRRATLVTASLFGLFRKSLCGKLSLREFWGAPPHFQIFASSLA
jgi:hypothetical protein